MARKIRAAPILGYTIIIILVFVTLAPFYWMVSSSFKPYINIVSTPQTLYPTILDTTGYTNLFAWGGFGRALTNSAIVATSTAFATVLIAILGAYALARFRFRGKGLTLNLLIMTQIFPGVATLIPLEAIFVEFHLIDTLMGLVLVYTAHVITFVTWLMMGFYSGVPVELEEAGMVDGASRIQGLFRIVLPLMIPALVTTFLLAWTASWGELITATLFTRTLNAETLPVALNAATTNVAGGIGQIDYQSLFAGATLLTLPPVLIFLIFQKYFRPSMTLGALKT